MKKPGVLKKKKTKFIIIPIIVAVLGIGGYLFYQKQANKAPENVRSINTEEIKRQTLTTYVDFTGTINANDEQTIYTSLMDREVLEVLVEVGDEVKAGDVLAVLDATDDEYRLKKAEKQLSVQQARTALSLKRAERDLNDTLVDAADTAEHDAKSIENASKDYGYSIGDRDIAYRELQEAIEDYEEAKDDYEDARSAYRRHKKALDNADKKATEIYVRSKVYTYDELKAKVSELKAKEESLESKKDNLEDTVQSREDALAKANQSLERQYRSYDDAIENQEDNNVKTARSYQDKVDSLESANLDAMTSTDNIEEQIRSYKKQIEKCTITAPISGIITSVKLEEGDITANDKNTLCTINDTSVYRVVGNVDEYDISKIREGMKAVIKTEATGDTEMTGTVDFVSQTANASSNTNSTAGSSSSAATYQVKVVLDKLDDAARIGMTAETQVILEKAENVLTVPYDCVVKNDRDEDVIYVLEGEAGAGGRMEVEDEDGVKNNKRNRSGNMFGGPGMGRNSREVSAGGEDKDSFSFGKEIKVKVGLKGDYDTEVSSNEIHEGMRVIVPDAEDDDNDFRMGGMFF